MEKKLEEIKKLQNEICQLKENAAKLESEKTNLENVKNGQIKELVSYYAKIRILISLIEMTFFVLKEQKIEELNLTLTNTTKDLTEKKVEATTALETEIKKLKEAVSKLETDKSALESLKNSQISDLVRLI